MESKLDCLLKGLGLGRWVLMGEASSLLLKVSWHLKPYYGNSKFLCTLLLFDYLFFFLCKMNAVKKIVKSEVLVVIQIQVDQEIFTVYIKQNWVL